MAGSAPLPDRTNLDQPDPRLYRPTRPRYAKVVLSPLAGLRLGLDSSRLNLVLFLTFWR